MQDATKIILSDIKDLEPQLKARVMEFETARRIAPDVVATLKSIGVFRMLVPRSHGGLELDLPTALEIIATIARIDGSLGWTAMIGSGTAIFAPLLPRKTYDGVYRNGPDIIVAGSTQPVGTAEATADGWRVSGRWPFASGCQHSDFLIGVCVMMKDGKPLSPIADEGGSPATFGFALPASPQPNRSLAGGGFSLPPRCSRCQVDRWHPSPLNWGFLPNQRCAACLGDTPA